MLGERLISNSTIIEKNFNLLEDAEFQVYSQNGEDGIINFIINRLNIKKPNFVELGVGDYSESNTRLIYEKYYSQGLIVDCESDLKNKVSENINLWKGNLKIINEFVETENINKVLKENCAFEIDLFSIDLDGIDYWILKELDSWVKPKLFIVEYNANFGDLEVTVPNIKKFKRENYHCSNLCYGASILAFEKLMKKKGYYLLGVNRLRNNAFFISNDYPKDKFFSKIALPNKASLINANYSESKNILGNLSFLNLKERKKLIKNCKVVDLRNNLNQIISLKDKIS